MLITSKYHGTCKKCGKTLSPGDRVNWEPGKKGVTCTTCDPIPTPRPGRASPLPGGNGAPAPADLWLAVLASAEKAIIENAVKAPTLSPELEAAWERYQKIKALALAPGTPEEGKVALRRALLDVIKLAV